MARGSFDGEAGRWLAFAREDLEHGRLGASSFPRSASWSFQQSAEKALKGVLISEGKEPPRSHDVGFLLAQVCDSHAGAESLRESALLLSEVTPAIRYPGDWPELTAAEVRELRTAAEQIFAWAEKRISEGTP
jgi:HEPN domain-containing protein